MNDRDRRIEAERINREREAAAAHQRRFQEEAERRRRQDEAERDRRRQEQEQRQRRDRERQQEQARQKRKQGNGGCFAGSTEVLTPGGRRCISDLRAGDKIVSYDALTRTTAVRSIVKYKTHKPAVIWEVHFSQGKDPISTTRYHSFLTARGWQKTHRLRSGDAIITVGSGEAVIAAVIKTERVEPVFNLHTEVEHTFVVADCVVHNFSFFRNLRMLCSKLTRSTTVLFELVNRIAVALKARHSATKTALTT